MIDEYLRVIGCSFVWRDGQRVWTGVLPGNGVVEALGTWPATADEFAEIDWLQDSRGLTLRSLISEAQWNALMDYKESQLLARRGAYYDTTNKDFVGAMYDYFAPNPPQPLRAWFDSVTAVKNRFKKRNQ